MAASEAITINDKREINGWVMYDWANSAFSTTVVTALLGPYILDLAKSSATPIRVFGMDIEAAAIYPFTISLSVLLGVFFLPLLGTAADFTPHKKRLMLIFAYAGAFATMALFFIRGDMGVIGTNGAVIAGSLLFIIANLCFGAAIVSYNSFLPEIASPDQRDKVSSKGFAWGYLGGGVLLVFNLGLLTVMDDTRLAVRISLASAGVWWLVFTYLFPHKRLRQRAPINTLPAGTSLFRFGVKRIMKTLREMRAKYPETLRYLIAYLIYNDGIQTVIVVSTAFALAELGTSQDILLLLVLMIQFVAFGGAYLFGWLAGRMGAKRAVMLSLVLWSAVVIYAFQFLYNDTQLFILGFVIAIVLGGSQALSRSLFSQMIPAAQQAEYFAFYEISERGTSWLGPLAFAFAVQITGSQRIAIVTLIIFFIVGMALLSRVDVRKAMQDVGNDPTNVVL